MPRQKKNSVPVNMRMDAAVLERLDAYCEQMGQNRTLAVERIVMEHIDRYERENKGEKGSEKDDK